MVVILGPSGSGKTTFLRCLNHLEKADGGQLTISGKDYSLDKLSKKDILDIRKKTAFVFQHTIYLQTRLPLRISWKV